VLQNRLLGLARFLVLDFFVDSVIHRAPFRPAAVVLDEGAADGPRDLDDLGLEERRRAQRRAPRNLMGQASEESEDGSHCRHGNEAVVDLARITHVVADSTEEFVVIGRPTDLPTKISKILDEQMARAVLPDLEIVAPRVNSAEDPREP